jgi:HPt (histidine-containing phosphotransfer) domain-containing protein
MTAARDVETGPLDEVMEAFRDRARVSNLARLEVIADALDRLRGGVLPDDVRLTARRAAHSLVGSAGTFGLGEASQLGRGLEALLDEADGPTGTDARAEGGLELVASLREALTGAGSQASRTSGGDRLDRADG